MMATKQLVLIMVFIFSKTEAQRTLGPDIIAVSLDTEEESDSKNTGDTESSTTVPDEIGKNVFSPNTTEPSISEVHTISDHTSLLHEGATATKLATPSNKGKRETENLAANGSDTFKEKNEKKEGEEEDEPETITSLSTESALTNSRSQNITEETIASNQVTAKPSNTFDENNREEGKGKYTSLINIAPSRIQNTGTNNGYPSVSEPKSNNADHREKQPKQKDTSKNNSRNVPSNSNISKLLETSSKSSGSGRKIPQGRHADEMHCDRSNKATLEGEEEESDSVPKTPSRGTKLNNVTKLGIQGAESNILPQTKNVSITPVLPTAKTNNLSTSATTISTTNQEKRGNNLVTIQPAPSTPGPTNASTNAGKWKKALDIIGRFIGVFTVIGGAFYLVYSVV